MKDLTELDLFELQHFLHRVQARLPMFVITERPTDYPDGYVARLHLTLPEDMPTQLAVTAVDLDELRDAMAALGLVKLMRHNDDDPVILEVWL